MKPIPGAFFDVDGTLLQSPSLERRFADHLRYCGLLGGRQRRAWVRGLAAVLWARQPLGSNKRYLTGLPAHLITSQVGRFLRMYIRSSLDRFMLERVRAHQRSGHKVFLVTGSLQLLAEALAAELGIDGARGTRVRAEGGLFTGALDGPHIYEQAKVLAVRQLAHEHNINLSQSFAYANESVDLPFLNAVGHPAAVQPDKKLLAHAEDAGWPVYHLAGLQPTPLPVTDNLSPGEAA